MGGGPNNEQEVQGQGGEGLDQLQGSVRKAVKTQEELLAEKSELSVGEGTIGDTFEDKETEDDNHDGVPDDEEYIDEDDDGYEFDWESDFDDYTDYDSEMNSAYGESDRDAGGWGVAREAADYVSDAAANGDATATTLKNNFESTRSDVKSALSAADQGHSTSNFLQLELAKAKNSEARADMVIYEGQKTGDTDKAARGEKWKNASEGMQSDLKDILSKPADQQEAALKDWAQKHPHSELAKDLNRYDNNQMGTWQRVADVKVMQQNQYSASSQYSDLPGEPLKGSSGWNLSSYFSWLSFGSSPTPSAPTQTTSPTAPSTTTPNRTAPNGP